MTSKFRLPVGIAGEIVWLAESWRTLRIHTHRMYEAADAVPDDIH
jgi:hypothetical protein